MAINIRQKGATGERDICDMLNGAAYLVLKKHGRSLPTKPLAQRNQNQSAVGGSDITNPFGLCVEVKRQENLSIGTWWRQCVTASKEFGGIPIVLYKQNHKQWKAVMQMQCPITNVVSVCQLDIDVFRVWLSEYLNLQFLRGVWDLPSAT